MAVSDIVFLVLGMLLLLMAGAFAAKGASDVTKNVGYATNNRLSSARSNLITSAVMSLVGMFIVLIALILTFVYGKRLGLAIGKIKWVMIGLVVFTFIIAFISGIFSAMAATKLNSQQASGRNWAIASTVSLFLGVALLFIIYMIILFLRRPNPIEFARQQTIKNYNNAKKALGFKPKNPEAASPLATAIAGSLDQ